MHIFGAGNPLEEYLTHTLGLEEGIDFHRHGKGMRGGTRYFDILTDDAISKLLNAAEKYQQEIQQQEESESKHPLPPAIKEILDSRMRMPDGVDDRAATEKPGLLNRFTNLFGQRNSDKSDKSR